MLDLRHSWLLGPAMPALAPPTAPARLNLAHESGSSALRLERGNHRAWLHVPSSARDQDTAEPLPLLVVLHGAGKNRFLDLKESVDSWAGRAEAHGMAVSSPRRSSIRGTSSTASARRGATAFRAEAVEVGATVKGPDEGTEKV